MREQAVMILTLMIVVAAVLLGPLNEAAACTCLPPGPVEEAFERAEAVFVGTIVKAQRQERFLKMAVEVKGSWKGVDGGEVELWTAQDTAACGYPFERDAAYIIYASNNDGQLWVSLCSRSRPLVGNEEELRALDGAAGRKVVMDGGEEPVGKQSALYPRSRCALGQEARVEEWGCALPLGPSADGERWIWAGEQMGVVCRLYGVPRVKSWRCEEPGPALR